MRGTNSMVEETKKEKENIFQTFISQEEQSEDDTLF